MVASKVPAKMLEHGIDRALKLSSAIFKGADIVGKVDHILTELLEILFLLATSPNILIKQ